MININFNSLNQKKKKKRKKLQHFPAPFFKIQADNKK